MDEYGTRLQVVCEQLARVGIAATIRGDGVGRFLFAERGSRAVEASMNDDGRVWVEFWSEPDGPSEREETYNSYEDATQAMEQWLLTA